MTGRFSILCVLVMLIGCGLENQYTDAAWSDAAARIRDGATTMDGSVPVRPIDADASDAGPSADAAMQADGSALDGGAHVDAAFTDGGTARDDAGRLSDGGAPRDDGGGAGRDASISSPDAGASTIDGGTACSGGFACPTGCCAYPPSGELAIDGGFDPDLDIDSADTLHVGFRSDGGIHQATYDGSGWVAEEVLPAPSGSGSWGDYEFAIDPRDDRMAIVFDTGFALRFRVRADDGWGPFETIDLVRGVLGVSFVYDDEGTPHVFYVADTRLHYATRIDGAWEVETISAPSAGFNRSSMAIDSMGRVHIAYFARALHYVRQTAIGWEAQVVAESGWVRGLYPSLALDSSDYPVISYHDSRDDDLWLARWDGTAWQHSFVDYEFYRGGRWTALVLDDEDEPIIAHQSISPHAQVRLSVPMDDEWSHTVLAREPSRPSASTRSFGLFTHMVRDSRGTVHLVFGHTYVSSSRRRVNEIHYARR